MHECRVWLQPDLVARIELVTLAEYGDDLLAAELGEHLGFRPVGSTTTISASAPSSAMVKCSGRTP